MGYLMLMSFFCKVPFLGVVFYLLLDDFDRLFFSFIGRMTYILVIEKKVMILKAKACSGMVQLVHHIDNVGFQTRVANKRKNIVEGKIVKVIPLTRLTLILVTEGAKSPPAKKSRTDSRKIPIDVDVIDSIDLEMDNIITESVGSHQQNSSFSSPGAEQFHFWGRSFLGLVFLYNYLNFIDDIEKEKSLEAHKRI